MTAFARAQFGTTSIEYALITTIITIGIITSLQFIGSSLISFFNSLTPYF